MNSRIGEPRVLIQEPDVCNKRLEEGKTNESGFAVDHLTLIADNTPTERRVSWRHRCSLPSAEPFRPFPVASVGDDSLLDRIPGPGPG